ASWADCFCAAALFAESLPVVHAANASVAAHTRRTTRRAVTMRSGGQETSTTTRGGELGVVTVNGGWASRPITQVMIPSKSSALATSTAWVRPRFVIARDPVYVGVAIGEDWSTPDALSRRTTRYDAPCTSSGSFDSPLLKGPG